MGKPPLESARIELYKMGSRLERDLLPFLQKDVRQVMGGVRVNIPNKTKGQTKDLLSSARAILGKVSKADVCLHYSLKNMPAGVRPFREFLLEAADLGVQAVLLVSGTGKKPKRDAVSCLHELAADVSESQLKLPRLGVAFSPFEDPELEQARLKDLGLGYPGLDCSFENFGWFGLASLFWVLVKGCNLSYHNSRDP